MNSDKQFIDLAINEGKNVYVKGIPPQSTDKSLFEIVKPIGHVISAKAILEQTSHRLSDGQLITIEGKCKGYGFIMFDNPVFANKAINHLNGCGFQASLAKNSFSSQLKMLQDSDSTNLYLFNLPPSLDELGLSQYINSEILYKEQGKVISSKILRTDDGRSRQAGFARVDSRKSAEICISKLSGIMIPGFADNYAQKDLKNMLTRKWVQQDDAISVKSNSTGVTAFSNAPSARNSKKMQHFDLSKSWNVGVAGTNSWVTNTDAKMKLMQQTPLNLNTTWSASHYTGLSGISGLSLFTSNVSLEGSNSSRSSGERSSSGSFESEITMSRIPTDDLWF